MTGDQYRRLSAPFRGGRREKVLLLANTVVTRLCYVAYPVLLIVLLCLRSRRVLPAFLVPAVSFVLVTVVRRALNAKRPYEVLDIQPIIQKDTKGKSLPSRHTFSVFVIAMTFLWLLPPVGIVMLVLGAALAAVRVIGGVHFPRDVLVGALVGVVCGLVGYWLIPW